MTTTKQPTSPATLFDNILSQRDAFKKKPATPEFPPLMDPDFLEAGLDQTLSSNKTSSATKDQAQKSKPRSLIPQRPEATKGAQEENPYVYAGAKGKKRIDWEGVDYKEAMPAVVLEEEQNRKAVEKAKALVKRSSTHGELDKRSKLILDSLPSDVRPKITAAKFPHIMNLVSGSWHEPKAFVQTLDELLIDDRGGRAGFPFDIIVELTDLREYYFSTVRPEARKLWDRL
jgi:hypothetical protein